MFGQHISFALDIVVLSASMCLAFSNLDIFPCVHNEIQSDGTLSGYEIVNSVCFYFRCGGSSVWRSCALHFCPGVLRLYNGT